MTAHSPGQTLGHVPTTGCERVDGRQRRSASRWAAGSRLRTVVFTAAVTHPERRCWSVASTGPLRRRRACGDRCDPHREQHRLRTRAVIARPEARLRRQPRLRGARARSGDSGPAGSAHPHHATAGRRSAWTRYGVEAPLRRASRPAQVVVDRRARGPATSRGPRWTSRESTASRTARSPAMRRCEPASPERRCRKRARPMTLLAPHPDGRDEPWSSPTLARQTVIETLGRHPGGGARARRRRDRSSRFASTDGRVAWADMRVGCHLFETHGKIKFLAARGGWRSRPPCRARSPGSSSKRDHQTFREGLGTSHIYWEDCWPTAAETSLSSGCGRSTTTRCDGSAPDCPSASSARPREIRGRARA